MSDLIERLHAGPPLLADGAMGTMLQPRGLPPGEASAPWALSHPEAVREVHAAYVAAGCELVLTNTLGAHEGPLSADAVAAVNRAAAALARRSGARWVAGSLGPGGDEGQARALAEARVDLFWIETQMSLAEALQSVAACQRVSALPIVVTFSFHRRDGRTQAGETAQQVAQALAAAGVAALGLNCGDGLTGAAERLAELASACTLPLVLKPNAGLPHLQADGWQYDLGPEAWATQVLAASGPRVRLLGGCCGSTPAHLRILREGLD